MNQLNKGKAKNISVLASVLLLFTVTVYCSGNSFYAVYFHSYLTTDTIPVKVDSNKNSLKTGTGKSTVQVKQNQTNPDTIIKPNRTTDTIIETKVDTFLFKASAEALDEPVVYHADDSMIMDVPAKKITLYGKKARVDYLDNELIAPLIEYDQQTNMMSAYLTKDSTGNVIAYPQFNQGELKTKSDTVRYNPKSGKGLTKGTYTQQDEIFVYGDRIKKTDPDIFYALRGRFTTCNLDTPHFAFVSKKIKFINNKMAITGPVHPEFESVPIPLYLPFGIYPLKTGRHSGILPPTFTANETLGLSLDGLGYYKVLNDKWDIVVKGTIYSYGGWTANVSPTYYKRYHYRGGVVLNVLHLKDLDNSGQRGFNVQWRHGSDSKARPGVSFNASVNAGSSGYNSAVPNNPQRNFQNILQSSVTYSKIWKDKPFSLNVSGNHNQNTNTKLMNINLPDIGFNVNTLYPFRRKEVIGQYKWYENVGVALNTNIRSLSTFYDTLGNFFNEFVDKLQWGASHNVPITLSLPQIGNFQFAPSVSYQERWYQEKFIRSWDSTKKKIDTTIQNGFFTAREMSFGMGVSARIFGLFTFKKKSSVQAIRHEIRPTLSASYKPDMNRQFWYSTQIDTFGRYGRYSVHERGIFGAFGEGKFGGLNFGIDNNIQMKVRNRKDTGEAAIKKVTLIDGFSITSSYNFLEDSFQLKPFNISMRTNLFDKISISAGAVMVPYVTNSVGEFTKELIWNKKVLTLGKLTSANIALQTQFKGGDKNEKLPGNNLQQQQQINPVSGFPLDEYQQEAAYISNNPGEFANFNIPWSVSLSYSFNYNRIPNGFGTGYKSSISQSVTWNGTLNITPKWQMGLNGSYNISQKELGLLSINLSREMHCWQMTINLSPVGKYRSFSINISPKSGILRDLKINRTRYFYEL